MSKRVILVWFRNDLRTSDNEVLLSAVEKSDFIIPVYIFDPRYYTVGKFNFSKTGELRQKYITQTVASLKRKLELLGGDLLTYEGYPEEIIPQLVQKYDVDEVYHHREVARRETHISELVEESLWKVKRNLKHFIGHTMYHKEDLPFPIKDIPNDFNTFKKKVAKESFVRTTLADINKISLPPHLEKAVFPYDISEENLSNYGEEAAQLKLQEILNHSDNKNDFYTSISPFLALGVLSPAQVYHFVQSNLNAHNKKKLNFLLDGLLWRDYYRFMLKKFPNRYFKTQNLDGQNPEILESFVNARTNCDYVNELVEKINKSGELNRDEREYLALYFVYALKQNWLNGAAFFEQQLIDYAPATIYGFWAHIGEEGTSSKNNRSQADWERVKKCD